MVKVPKALKNLLAKQPRIDAIFVVGDISDYGQEHQDDMVLKVFNDTTIVPAQSSRFLSDGKSRPLRWQEIIRKLFQAGTTASPIHRHQRVSFHHNQYERDRGKQLQRTRPRFSGKEPGRRCQTLSRQTYICIYPCTTAEHGVWHTATRRRLGAVLNSNPF